MPNVAKALLSEVYSNKNQHFKRKNISSKQPNITCQGTTKGRKTKSKVRRN